MQQIHDMAKLQCIRCHAGRPPTLLKAAGPLLRHALTAKATFENA